MRETLWSLATIVLLVIAWSLSQYGHTVGLLYLVSAFSGFMVFFPSIIAGVAKVYETAGLPGIVLTSALIFAMLTLTGALASVDGKDRANLFVNFFVGLIGFATGVGYRRIAVKAGGDEA